ncbi:PepSY domain-containing protein [Flavimarina sp. Hel_I_48]|uniref:PepSY domain-containing protein n=1 Tax=Flavimarina sp. Hel_I_48 TaxID=1392488 RepID=UPI0004DF046F|nr:PepSY domain-containing protein [Flavimarina sp. Hel_I_48]
MTEPTSRKKQAKFLRTTRKVHRIMGILLFVFFIVISVSGILLGWKKHSNGVLLPATTKGTSTELAEWLPLQELEERAFQVLHDSVDDNLSLSLDRIDVRKEKGIVKFIFAEHLNSIQLDGATGKVLQIGIRRSDFIERVHDGSILDDYFNISNGFIKVTYTTMMGIALLLFSLTGFWLWYGPKRMKNAARN